MSILDTFSGRILPNWSVIDSTVAPGGQFWIVAPYKDGLPGEARLASFAYRPHAELAARAPAMAAALEAIASCEVRAPGDVVDIARKALGQ